MPNSKKKTILITLEHKEREYLPKLLLAGHLVQRGFRVILGSSEAVHEISKNIQPSIFFHKSTHPKSGFYKKLGHTFVFLDEEGGVTTPVSTIEEFCAWRYLTISPERQDVVLLPGQRWFDAVQAMPNVQGVELHVTGWPRVDLWRKKYDQLHADKVENILSEHGDFYLFPTSFGAASSKSFMRLIASSPNDMFASIQSHKMDAFNDYLELLLTISPQLSAGEKIILRPHPSEDVREWKSALRGTKNIEVIREGDISPWILAAKSLLQFGSTTVTQAALNGKLNVQYRVKEVVGITDSPSFDLCVQTHSPAEALYLLSNPPLDTQIQIDRAAAILKKEAALDEKELAVSKIVRVLDSLEITPIQRPKFPLLSKLKVFAIYHGSALKFLIQRLGIPSGGLKTVYENLPGGITSKEVSNSLRRIGQIEQWESAPIVRQVGKNLVQIETSIP